jgi:hypothetical protein
MSNSSAPHDMLFHIFAVARFASIWVEEAKRLIAFCDLPTFDMGTTAWRSKPALRPLAPSSRAKGENLCRLVGRPFYGGAR